MIILKLAKSNNYLNVNLMIKKGMLKRRNMATAAILNIVVDKSHIKVVK